ncbi:NUDIX domain-containing protein [Bacillus sp. NEB1478]|uniref:NUDIX hydrolase n=1 Tax=Bacillus sp. NEB1478 TaxID=3073816 RepID=UPI0028735FF5|nr:NUDIX domain-containing protein [Bacillus sp. NEB1478]WNB91099.1 NUDIX domain-containing protein [Bacillus sp. NEB1478]
MDKKIASVHCIPIMENGTILMAWDEEEQLLTTIGGRREGAENLYAALEREVMEEAGITLQDEKIPFASWYWESTDTYTIWFLAKVDRFVSTTFEHEKTGYVIFNFETAKQLIPKVEENPEFRIQIVNEAELRAKDLEWI